ncbi:MAG: ankyrin repeat domain-containing protein, partial [Candidatus Accumulibacter sp.]|nr:ankyrin repeat domain-containing protein [Accumulibacter sp.]
MSRQNSHTRLSRFVIACLIAPWILCFGGCGTGEAPTGGPRVHSPAEPALIDAIIAGNIEETRKFLAAGTDVNAVDALDRTPLHVAAFHGRTRIVKLLLANGAEVNARDQSALTPLHAAVISGERAAANAGEQSVVPVLL